MARNNFNGLLKECVIKMYVRNKQEQVNSIAGYGVTEEAKRILQEIVTLVIETKYFKPDTKEFLSGKFKTFRTKFIGSGCADNPHTSRSRINYDLQKLRSALGEDALDIIIKQKGADLTRYKEKVEQLIQKHKQKSLLEGFLIKLPKCNELVSSISEDDKINLISIARMQSKKGRLEDEKRMTADMVGYIKYLEQNQKTLKDEQLEYYECLSEWLK